MKKLDVIFRGWGQNHVLGVLADFDGQVHFAYSADAIERGIEHSPYKLKLSPGTQTDFPRHLNGLPGFINDALPDGWGILLMDRVFRQAGRDPATVSALDRLSFVGERAMGAFAFRPSADFEPTHQDPLHINRSGVEDRFRLSAVVRTWPANVGGRRHLTLPGGEIARPTGASRPIPARRASPKLSDARRWLLGFRCYEAAVRDLTRPANCSRSLGGGYGVDGAVMLGIYQAVSIDNEIQRLYDIRNRKEGSRMSEPTTISSKGQVTVPRDVRERLGLQAGDKIAWSMLSNGTIVLRPKTRRLADLVGILTQPGQPSVPVDDMRLPE